MSNKRKRPSIRDEPRTERSPRIRREPQTSFDGTPSWRLSRLEMHDPYGWHKLDRETAVFVLGKLKEFESMTMRELLMDGRKQNHNIEVYKLCREAQRRLQELQLDDIEQVLSLRLGGRQRVWGIMQATVISLLWWDPEHEICPSELKNT